MIFLIFAFVDLLIMYYTLFFLVKIRFYPPIFAKMKKNIITWSWCIVCFGVLSGFMPYYSIRSIVVGMDITSYIALVIQIVLFVYVISLFIFHIKNHKK